MQFLRIINVSSTLNLTVKYQSSLGLNSKAFLALTLNESHLTKCLRCVFLKHSYFLMLHYY